MAACGKSYKKLWGGKHRRAHIQDEHGALFDAVVEFRTYQFMIRGLKLPEDEDDADEPSNVPGPTFHPARQRFVEQTMRQPLPHEQKGLESDLVRWILYWNIPFRFFESRDFKGHIERLNNLYRIPTANTLTQRMEYTVHIWKHMLKSYILNNVRRCAITADSWQSRGKKHFLGVTLHFMTAKYKMISCVIGMERIIESQTAEELLKIISKLKCFLFTP